VFPPPFSLTILYYTARLVIALLLQLLGRHPNELYDLAGVDIAYLVFTCTQRPFPHHQVIQAHIQAKKLNGTVKYTTHAHRVDSDSTLHAAEYLSYSYSVALSDMPDGWYGQSISHEPCGRLRGALLFCFVL